MIENAKIKRKNIYDKNINPINIDIGDLVYLKNENRKKLDNPYKGPYEVIELNGVNTRIKIGFNVKEVHNNRLKKYDTNNWDKYNLLLINDIQYVDIWCKINKTIKRNILFWNMNKHKNIKKQMHNIIKKKKINNK